ncbi:4-amino-4-deoxychorismate lyase [Pasteurella testudinis DSM 23072]|uniref:4-amino-4-deoxychorismate lyase n=1 Tax=Pasteurella testudinis DSM 23072 TaxID=1122938 RepID=A0A1W1UGH4_9PAST|nr:aminotransferase class IV family protein [Pasteurella testudinis]SMB79911.1 4-amino-4-deoxychorismate lyase [Pasteurella testudinis DSM 23072]SUB50647.1 aminotransferase, class IV family protein [Pasteurella testudinis]
MLPLIETIAVQDGVLQNVAYHQQRYQQALARYYSDQKTDCLDLSSIAVPCEFRQGLVRCRMDYNAIEQQVRFFAYQRREFRRFKPIICDQIDYALKFSDRTLLDQLYAQRGDCDEILIIKHGMVTDCSIGNVVLRQNGIWYTPDTPLLAGTQRAKLLAQHKIQLRSIPFAELAEYGEVRVINAMNPL